jgi:hypothetical protein
MDTLLVSHEVGSGLLAESVDPKLASSVPSTVGLNSSL